MDVESFISLVELPANSCRFVLGPFEPGITLVKQQTRALNLLYSLRSTNRLSEGSNIAIIGGGVAGITAAAAGAQLKCSITLIERKHQLVHLQKGCDTRWLHPHVYDWPEIDSQNTFAGLPLLNWYASSASRVAHQLLTNFRQSKNFSEIEIYQGATIHSVNGRKIKWHSINPKKRVTREFDIIIFAVGFGIEQDLHSRWPSYWRNDSLHQSEPSKASDEKATFLISGIGDGGLIDLM